METLRSAAFDERIVWSGACRCRRLRDQLEWRYWPIVQRALQQWHSREIKMFHVKHFPHSPQKRGDFFCRLCYDKRVEKAKEALINSALPSWRIFFARTSAENPPHSLCYASGFPPCSDKKSTPIWQTSFYQRFLYQCFPKMCLSSFPMGNTVL